MQIGDHIGKRHHFTSITSTSAARARQLRSSVPLRLGNARHTCGRQVSMNLILIPPAAALYGSHPADIG